jgi:AraC-like DNA-binding protein
MRDVIGLYHRAAAVTGLRSFGLQSTTDVDVQDHGLIGHYVMQAQDLPNALGRFRTALPHHENGSSLELETRGNELRIGYRTIYQDLVGWQHGGDFTLCVIADVISSFLGDDWRPLRIETCYKKGSWLQDHEDHFDAPVHADQDRVAIVLDRQAVRSSKRRRPVERDALVTIADLRRLSDSLPRDFLETVANTVDHRMADGVTDLENTASTLGLGPRTLQRRLSDFGLSYRELLLRCRMRRARDLLAEPQNGVSQVAKQVGYASTAQFTRAFKAYTGTAPRKFRARLQ